MEAEAKVDEDFLFYLGFAKTFLQRVTNAEDFRKSKTWIYKLLVERCEGLERKRYRNMYLAQLLICMQNGKLEPPFTYSPVDVDIGNAMEIFGPIPKTVEKPAWLNDSDYTSGVGDSSDVVDRKGRTYLATRTMPNGQGAFAYIGVSLTDEAPFIQAAAGAAGDTSLQRASAVDRQIGEKFNEMVPPVYELEKILAKRRDPREREKVLTFYDVLLQNIADELDGKGPQVNETVEGLIEQLMEDLRAKEQYDQYEALPEANRRTELLLLLYDRVKVRRDKVAKREEILDDIEQKVFPQSFFETSLEPEDKYELPAAMWTQAINRIPPKKQMERLLVAYPAAVVEKFLELLGNYKENIATTYHRRHENIVTQMKKELRKEGAKIKEKAEELQRACARAEIVWKAVKEQYRKKLEAEDMNRKQGEIPVSEHSKIYEQMREAIFDTQKLVEEEAMRGKFLAEQINQVSEQNALFAQVNDDIVRKAEEANMKIMRNIKRVTQAIRQYENRISDLRNMTEQTKKGPGGADPLVMMV